MKIYTLIETKAEDYGSIDITIRPIISTVWDKEAKDKLKEIVRGYFYDYLYTAENEEYMEECENDPRMADFEQVYQFFLSDDAMSWGVNEWVGNSIEFTIVETELNIE